VVAPTLENFTELRNRANAAGNAPLVVHRRDAMLRLGEVGSAGSGQGSRERIAQLQPADRLPVQLVRYQPAELVFRVQPPTAGWLLVTDRWARGWRAQVNGVPAEVFGGNFIFRAIEIPAGVSEVRFWYRTSGFPWLLIASWGTLAAIGGRAGYRAIRDRISIARSAG